MASFIKTTKNTLYKFIAWLLGLFSLYLQENTWWTWDCHSWISYEWHSLWVIKPSCWCVRTWAAPITSSNLKSEKILVNTIPVSPTSPTMRWLVSDILISLLYSHYASMKCTLSKKLGVLNWTWCLFLTWDTNDGKGIEINILMRKAKLLWW